VREGLSSLLADQVSGPRRAPESARSPTDRQFIAQSQPESVLEALRSEPHWLITALLQTEEWPWAAAVQEELPALRLPDSEATGLRPRSAALEDALARHFAARLRAQAQAHVSGQLRPVPRFEQLLNRFVSMRRTRRP
jgi:hypothetical protein